MMGLNSTSLKLISRSVHGFYPVVCGGGGGGGGGVVSVCE